MLEEWCYTVLTQLLFYTTFCIQFELQLSAADAPEVSELSLWSKLFFIL